MGHGLREQGLALGEDGLGLREYEHHEYFEKKGLRPQADNCVCWDRVDSNTAVWV